MIMMFENKVVALAVTLLLLSSTASVFGESSTTYYVEGNGSEEKTISLDGENEDSSVSIKFPATEVLEANIGVTGLADSNGNYPEGVSIGVKNYEWKYDGTGYGALGHQEKFSSNAKGASARFAEEGEQEISLYLPTNASVTDASVDITGLPYGSGDLTDYSKSSVDTNGGSTSSAPAVSMYNDDYYVAWVDDGDLEQRSTSIYSIKFRGYIDGSWEDIVLIASNDGETSAILSDPVIRAHDDLAVVTWLSDVGGEVIEASYSTNQGQSWSTGEQIEPGSTHYLIYDYDGAVGSDGNMHVVWSSLKTSDLEEEYHIYYQKSEDLGQTWDDEILLSESDSSSSIGAQISVTGNNVHITWEQYYESQSYYAAEYVKSADGGDTFGSPSTISSSNTVAETTITSEGTTVVIGWMESTSEGYAIKAKSSSNSGGSFSSEQVVQSADGSSLAFLESNNDGSNNYYMTWRDIDNIDSPSKIMASRSANSGSSWNTPINVDGIDNGDVNEFRASPTVEANGDRVLVVWSDVHDGSGASNDQDIVYSVSANDGSTWSDMDDISEHYYEADSGSPSIDYSGDYLYLVYLDNGDYDQEGDTNGCDQSGRDGDVYFTRSDNGGESWEELSVLSNFDEDYATDLDYSSTTLQYRADVSGTGNDVHVAWTDYNGYTGVSSIYYTKSSNNGKDWSEPEKIDSGNTGVKYGLSISSNGDNVVATWTNTYNYDIYTVRSIDGGSNWDNAVLVSGDTTGLNYMPEIVYNSGKFHLVWSDSTYGESLYYTNSNTGDSWADLVYLNEGTTAYYSYSPVISAEGENLFVAWTDNGDYDGDGTSDYDVVWAVSNDNGETWNDVTVAIDTDTSSTYLLPSIASGSGFTYLSYQYASGGSYDYYFAFTQDEGGSWSDQYEITDFNDDTLTAKYHRMDMVMGDKTYFAFTEETDISGGDEVDTNVYVRSTLSDDYPENPYIKLSNNKDWEWAGELNADNSPQNWGDSGGSTTFKNALNDALEEAIENEKSIVDEFGVEMSEIVLTVGSSSKGTVGFNELTIEYDVKINIKNNDLVSALNAVIENADDLEAEVAIKLNSETPGRVKLSDLNVITTDADLSIDDLTFTGELIEGNDVGISAVISNEGEGDARVTVEFKTDDELIATVNVEGVTGGETKSVTTTWRDIPEGSHTITVEIVNSVPTDSSQGAEDSVSQSISVSSASPEITYEIEFGDMLVEGLENTWSLEISNDGEKYGEITTTLYWDDIEDEDNIIVSTPQTKVDVDESKMFDGTITPTNNVEKLYILIEDSVEGVLYDEEVSIDINFLPKLVVTGIVWEDDNGNILSSVSDGSVATARISVMNQGSFDITANTEIRITKGDKDLQVNFGGVLSPGFGSTTFPAGEETTVTFFGKYPEITFLSDGKSDFIGFWTIELSISEVTAINSNEQFWDSEELIFSDSNNRIEVSTPPSLAVTSFTSNTINANEGDLLTLTIYLANEGGAAASGNINLLESGRIVSTTNFTIDGFGSTQIDLEHTLPEKYADGEIRLKVAIDRNSVIPALGSQDILTDDSASILVSVKGTLKENEVAESSEATGDIIVIAGAGGVALVGAAAGYFFYNRSKSAATEVMDDPFGGGAEQPPAPAAPPIPEQPPAAAPPVQPPAAAPPVPEQPPAPQPEAPPAAAPGETVLSVAVPPGVQPGQQIQIKAPDGRVVAVTIPEGLQPGQQFQIKV